MKKEYKIINEVYYWKTKLNIPFFLIDVDNKTKFVSYVSKHLSGYPKLTLNLKKIIKINNCLTLKKYIFHEFGHIINKTYLWKVQKPNEKSEYLAEKFAIIQIKKYYPNKYLEIIKEQQENLKNSKWKKKYPVYYKSYYKLYCQDLKNKGK